MNPKLQQAQQGQTVIITWREVGIDYNNNTGFPSLADLSNWCVTFNLVITTVTIGDGQTAYQISKNV